MQKLTIADFEKRGLYPKGCPISKACKKYKLQIIEDRRKVKGGQKTQSNDRQKN